MMLMLREFALVPGGPAFPGFQFLAVAAFLCRDPSTLIQPM